jgi:hypothetical protein
VANWVLKCPNCHSTFVHSEIENNLANFFFPAKPAFPEGGQSLSCKHCGHTAKYQQNELVYQQ